MGTDIHLHVEKRSADTGEWETADPPYSGRDSWDNSEIFGWYPWWLKHDDPLRKEIPDPTSRHYTVFAFLADVRNGWGFAGVQTGEPIEPQFKERGIPIDTTYRETVYDKDGNVVGGSPNWLGDHSFTWATLRELKDAPWKVTVKTCGVIHHKRYAEWSVQGGPPKGGWGGSIFGKGIRTFDEKDFKGIMAAGQVQEEDYVRVWWEWHPLIECQFRKWLYSQPMQDLLEEVGNNPDHIRVLMGFDS